MDVVRTCITNQHDIDQSVFLIVSYLPLYEGSDDFLCNYLPRILEPNLDHRQVFYKNKLILKAIFTKVELELRVLK